MFPFLLSMHSLFRWLTVISLLVSFIVAVRGVRQRSLFPPSVNSLRHSTATIAHIQLMIGIWLYTQSAQVGYYFSGAAKGFGEAGFFSIVHICCMILAIVFITLGSALAKRRPRPLDKYRTMMWWFGAALVLIVIAIPWPFSPLAHRPMWRAF